MAAEADQGMTEAIDLRHYIRDVPDFPQPGIVFRDITPLLADRVTLRLAVEALSEPFRSVEASHVAGMEARGFILGALVARALDVGFVPLRKPGKLPHAVDSVSYALEYGAAALEMHLDALGSGDRVLLVDDLIATGGTAEASCELVARRGAAVVGCAFLIELEGLGGRARLPAAPIHAVLRF